MRLHASIRDLDDMARTLIRLGCPFRVLQPPELRVALRHIAADIDRFAADGFGIDFPNRWRD